MSFKFRQFKLNIGGKYLIVHSTSKSSESNLNSGIESTNAVIKAEHTLRERLPVGHFLKETFSLVRKWSLNRNPESVNFIPFADVPSIPLKLWTTSYQWAMLNLKVLQTETYSEIICYMCST